MTVQAVQRVEWERRQHRAPTVLVLLLLCALSGAVVWANFAVVQIYALAKGTLEPRGEMVALDSSLGGRVVQVLVKPWQRVTKNQVLFVLDATGADAADGRLQQQMLAAQLEETRRDTSLAQFEVRETQKQVQTLSSIFAVGGVARIDLEQAQAKLEQARLRLERALAHSQTLAVQTQQLQGRRGLTVRAPVTGLLTRLSVRGTAQMIEPRARLAEILPEGVPLEFRASLLESDRPKLRLDARAEISWNGFPRAQYGVTSGRVVGVAPFSSLVQGSSPVFEFRIAPDSFGLAGDRAGQNPRRLLPGMAGEARVIAERKTALVLAWEWLRGLNPWD